MRHAVLKDLIFSGCTECYVELVFSEFVIKRSLRLTAKSCTSAYFINNSEKQSQEVICFLKDKDIDLDNNRFLILQGEIETISMMSPLELLDYIEDCIECCSNDKLSLKMQIQNLEDEIKTKQEELEMQENSLKFIETDFNYKKGRRDEKYDILSYRSESLGLKNKICLIKKDICMRKEKKLHIEKDRLKNAIEELAIRNKGCVGKIKDLESLCDGINLKSKEEALLKYKKEYQRIERENKAKDLKRSRLERNIERVEKEIVDTRQKLKNFASESVLLNESLKKNCSEIEEFEREIEEKTTELSGFKDFIDLDKEKKSLERILIEKMNKREAMRNNKAFLLDSKLKCINNQIFQLRENKAINISDLAGAEKEANQLRSDIHQTTQEIQKRKRRSEDFKFIEQSYLKERDVLLNLQEVKGVYGFLKDLGTIEKGYEDAVDASTKTLSSIVVENTKVAEECVSIINQKKLARTTFVILDKLENNLPKSNLAEANNLLYKKIKCDAKFEKCFYFALRDTMVMKTAEEAKSLAFGRVRRRVVTVDGKLFEKSGVMSGGKLSKKIKSSHELEDLSKKMNAFWRPS